MGFKLFCYFPDKHDYNTKLSDIGLAKDGPVGDKPHVSTRIMRTYGYTSPEYIMTGHLKPRSDVYSFGVVLLKLVAGRKCLDKSRPAREHNLTDWDILFLKEKMKLLNIIDPQLQEDYPINVFHKAAMLSYHCLNRNPKPWPLMRNIVDSLEPLEGLLETLKDQLLNNLTHALKDTQDMRLMEAIGLGLLCSQCTCYAHNFLSLVLVFNVILCEN